MDYGDLPQVKQIREDEIVFNSNMREETKERLVTLLQSSEQYKDLVFVTAEEKSSE